MIFPNLKTFRELRNYTQKYMAARLGITQNGYSLLENGKTEMDVNQLLMLATILKVSPLMIVGRPVEITDIAGQSRVKSRGPVNGEIAQLNIQLAEKDSIIKELVEQIAVKIK